MGSVQFDHLNSLTRKIWEWCQSRNIYLFASYIKSSDNKEADAASRTVSNNDTEWELNSTAFQDIVNTFGFPEIDLFASRLNYKCKKFVSWTRDPEAYAIDAFTTSWKPYFFYAFPTFCLLLRVLQKIHHENATGIVVVPFWPSQVWFPLFMSLLSTKPLYFSPANDLLSLPTRTPHPLWKDLTLVAGILSPKR